MTATTIPSAPAAASSFRHILAVVSPADTDATALAAAAELAGASAVRLSVLSVLELPTDLDRIARAAQVSRADVADRLTEDHRARVASCVRATLGDIEADISITVGKPFIEIIRYVDAHGVDLVVKAAEEPVGLDRYLFSSTDQHLLRKCPCPVWLRVPQAPRVPSRILAAVDIGDELTEETEALVDLNRSILETAMRMASIGSATIHVLHAWEAPGEGLVQLWSGASNGREAAVSYVRDVQIAHQVALDRLIGELHQTHPSDLGQRIAVEPVLRRGPARRVVPEQVDALNADVLVMGTIARTGIPGFIIGNTAEDILNTVDCSVVTVKPPAYVSPVIG